MSRTRPAPNPSGRRLACRAAIVCLLAITGLQAPVGPAGARADAPPAEPREAPPEKPPVEAEVLNLETVHARQRQVEETAGLDEGLKSRLIEIYKAAQAELESAEKSASKRLALHEACQNAPARIEQIKAEMGGVELDPSLSPGPEATLGQWEQALSKGEAAAAAAEKATADWEARSRRRAERRVEVPKLLAAAKGRLKALDEQLATAAAEGPAELTQALRTLQAAQRLAVAAEIAALDAELESFEPLSAVWPLERDLATHNLVAAQRRLAELRETVHRRRLKEAEAQAARARAEAAKAHPRVRLLAEQNSTLAEQRTRLAEKMDQVSRQLAATDAILGKVQDDYRRLTEKVKAAGLNYSIGSLLRRQRAELPDVEDHGRLRRARQAEIAEVQLELYDLEDQRFESGDLDAQVARALASLEPQAGRLEQWFIESELRRLLDSRRDYLDALIADYDRYFRHLIDLDARDQELVQATEETARYIDERVLWIRSTGSLSWADALKAWETLAWLGGRQRWSSVGGVLVADARRNPLVVALLVLVFGLLLPMQYRVRRRIREQAEIARRNWNDRFQPTLHVLMLSGFLTVLRPAVMWLFGWRLGQAPQADDFVKGVAASLEVTALAWLMIEMVRQVARRHGLADAHFAWPVASLRILRRNLSWLSVWLLTVIFVCTLLESQGTDARRESLGRLAFILGLLGLAVFVQRTLRPVGGVFHEALARNRGGWLDRLQGIWYPLALGAPVSIAALAAAGYYYTAQQLSQRLFASAWLLWSAVVAHAVLERWALLARRKLAMKQARERRAANQAEADEAAKSAPDGAAPLVEPGLDLSTMNAQTRRLLRILAGFTAVAGLWLIWVDVLPALRIFDSVALWTNVEDAAEQLIDDETGKTSLRMVERFVPVTLADLLAALFLLGLTIGAARNLPGVLEFTVLQRLPLEPSIRYAVTTICRYAITLVGIVLAFEAIGVGWAKVQWLVAAITVGLGFGLQEIFANFVSGLIILFERPVRVGDTVTVGATSGTVTRIRMRATTITDWDRKELIVPNKEFITGHLVNWTLTDPIVRMVLRFGLAYGSDTELARALLLKIAADNPMVLDNPAPVAVFNGFGESALDFELRVFVPSLDCFLKLRHELNTAIDGAFREHGIEIAFPQRELHIRTIASASEPIPSAARGAAA